MTDEDASTAAPAVEQLKARATRRGRTIVLVSSLLTLPAGYLLLLGVGLAPMACDSCFGEELERFNASFRVVLPIVLYGVAAVAAALVTTWVLVIRHAHTRTCHALALAAPAAVVILWVTFYSVLQVPD